MNPINQLKNCPICGSRSKLKLRLSRERILEELSNYWNSSPPNDIVDNSYDIFNCNNCQYEFSSPSIPGNNKFYSWIVGMTSYYSKSRWEFKIVLDKLKESSARNILDVGCGDGHFLDLVRKNISESSINFYGLEHTNESILAAKSRGFKIYDFNINENISELITEKFDAIVLFHVLEHVENPVDFLKNILSILNKGGKIYISTPLSPMHFERYSLDILNHPPHHLSRFSVNSYVQIARILRCNIHYVKSPSSRFFKRFLLCLRVSLNAINSSKSSFLRKIILSPYLTFKVCVFSIFNKDHNTILVELSPIHLN
jgi:2-polyprenyl-3-methyl-5-hydroxy-6-metoxy-1,4-benzoquinol methylase